MPYSPRYVVAITVLFSLLCARTATGQTLAADFRADIEKLMEVTGASAMNRQLVTLFTNSFFQGLKQAQPDVPERVVTVIEEVLTKEFSQMFDGADGIKADIVAMYAKHFTHDDIRGLLAFYSTDLGRKAVSTMPVLAQEGAVIGQRWSEANLPRIQRVLMERLKAEGIVPQH